MPSSWMMRKSPAIPETALAHLEANLIHEAAIGKIAGEQLIKLMTLGLTEKRRRRSSMVSLSKREKLVFVSFL